MDSSALKIPQITDDVVQQNQLLSLQNEILNSLTTNQKDAQAQLDDLCLYAERLVPNALASVMLLDDNNLLSLSAAPSAPAAVWDDFKNIVPAFHNGSCATAIHTAKPTFVKDTIVDDVWMNLRNIPDKYNILACWSFPVIGPLNKPIASFALSHFEHAAPNEFQKSLLSVCANLVSIILQREEDKKELWKIAHHDALTGLPNRLLLDIQLDHAIQSSKRNETSVALMFFDLDNFKDINDSFGHDFGDRVLIESMSLIKSCLRDDDIVFRHGGDEFLILLENIHNQMDVDSIGNKILTAFASPMVFDGQKITVSFSIGISFYPNDSEDTNKLLKHADIAMYQAKSNGKNRMHYFEPQLAKQIHEKILLEQEIRHGLNKDEFELYYQPQYIADSENLDSIEVLVRWNHPERGFLIPKDFLPIAEQSGLIREISIYVAKKACKQGSEWLKQGFDIPRIAINFSTVQLTELCAERLDKLLEMFDYPAEKLEIEITETLLMNRGKVGVDELQKMRSMGVTLAIDDFGTGYSSLSQLKDFPVHKLKIDQSFIDHVETSENDKVFAKTIINMGLNLGLTVVAEGVETLGQQQFLLENGCHLIQGFYRNRPMPKDDIEQLFSKI